MKIGVPPATIVGASLKCPECGMLYSKYGYVNHYRFAHLGKISWNKGLKLGDHPSIEAYAKKNRGKPKNGHPCSPETKKILAEKLRLAHAEGRAHNIGKSRWKNQPSWPEQWFMQVIENEFEDKNYKREVPFHRFSLDFVWEHKKRVIEIDGQQHDMDPIQKRRDLEKDRLLRENGWEVLRIRWVDLYKESKKWIAVAKEFIQGRHTQVDNEGRL